MTSCGDASGAARAPRRGRRPRLPAGPRVGAVSPAGVQGALQKEKAMQPARAVDRNETKPERGLEPLTCRAKGSAGRRAASYVDHVGESTPRPGAARRGSAALRAIPRSIASIRYKRMPPAGMMA